jgi:transposase
MAQCHINIEVMWLIEKLTPDFRTISDFRKDNVEALKKVFKAFTKICAELGLYNKSVGVQDGSKIRAVNSKDNNVTENKLNKKIELAEEKINEYLEEMDRLDGEESDGQKYTKEEIEEKIQVIRDRKEQYNKTLEELKESGETQRSDTDPESRLMKTANGGFDVCFNTQILVDPDSHLIGAFEVTNNCNDLGLLSPVTEQLKKDLDIDVMDVVADKGYLDMDDMLECLKNGTIPHVPSKSGADCYEFEMDYTEAEITEELISSTKPEDIQTCLGAGVLPDAYRDRDIEISVEEVEVYGSDEAGSEPCFTLNEEGTAVLCPNDAILNKVSRLHGKGKTRFASRSACKGCDDKCTTSDFKQVDLKDAKCRYH